MVQHMNSDSTIRTAASVLLLVLAGCSNDLTLPSNSGSGLGLSQVRGDGQRGTVGAPLPDPLVVRVADRFGNPVSGAVVTWEGTAGGGDLSQQESETNADGTTAVSWHLGEQVGIQRATAAMPGVTGSPVTFSAVVLF